MVEIQCGVCDKRDEMGLAWQSLPGSRSGLGTLRSASDAGGVGGALLAVWVSVTPAVHSGTCGL